MLSFDEGNTFLSKFVLVVVCWMFISLIWWWVLLLIVPFFSFLLLSNLAGVFSVSFMLMAFQMFLLSPILSIDNFSHSDTCPFPLFHLCVPGNSNFELYPPSRWMLSIKSLTFKMFWWYLQYLCYSHMWFVWLIFFFSTHRKWFLFYIWTEYGSKIVFS